MVLEDNGRVSKTPSKERKGPPSRTEPAHPITVGRKRGMATTDGDGSPFHKTLDEKRVHHAPASMRPMNHL